MKLSNQKIGTRLYAGFGVVILILVILVSVAYTNFAKVGAAGELSAHTYDVLSEANDLLISLINIETGERGFALTGKDTSLEPLNAGKQDFTKHLEKIKALTSDNPEQQERLKRLDVEQRQWLLTAIEPVIALRRSVVEGKETMDAVVAIEQQGKGKQGMDSMRGLLAQINNAEQTLLGRRAEDLIGLRKLTSMTLIFGGIAAAMIAAFLAIWLSRNITRPLELAVKLAERVALGDLTSVVEVRSKDETGQLMHALKNMNEALVRIVSEVRSGTDTISTASSEIAAGNMDLSSRTEQQASSLEETASSMEELTATVKQNADSAREANVLAASASQVAIKGGSVVSEVVQTMGSINESSRKIVDIIGVIDSIAFQTNILALNAAVEAARAGEQGRGFAVVAAEVRTLAQRSANAAKEIKTLIGNSVEKVDLGSKLVGQAGSTMDEVVESVKRVSQIISEITEASEEQRVGIEQVNQAILQMDQVTQQNAALVEEAAAAAGAMQDQAVTLSQVVSVFQLNSAQTPISSAANIGGRAKPTAKPAPKLMSASALKTAARPASSIQQIKGKQSKSGLTATEADWEEF